MRKAFALLAVALTLVFAVRAGLAADDKEKKDPPRVELTDAEKAIVEMTNRERAKKGLPPLKPNPILTKVARGHSTNMGKQNKADHILSDGKSPGDRTKEGGYRFEVCGENVGWGDWTEKKRWTNQKMMDEWMNSQAHRENILHKEFTEIGVGIIETDGKRFFTQLFAAPYVE
jgi:uncharacterized protein YkwD